MMALLTRLWDRINRRFDIVSDDPYYGWADERLDQIEAERRQWSRIKRAVRG